MSESVAELLTDERRERLAELADALIPGGLGLPSASAAQAQGKWMDRVFAARPDLARVVTRVIDVAGEPEAVLGALEKQDRAAFADFTLALAGAYLMNPRVCHLLGLPGNVRKPNPALADEADYYLRDDILGPVKVRGPIYRPTPPTPSTAGAAATPTRRARQEV